MAEDYAKDRADAHADFVESGVGVTLRSAEGATVDEATGLPVSSGNPIEVATYALNKNYRAYEINGTTILAGDRRVLLSAEDVFRDNVAPAVGMKLETPEGLFRVVDVMPLSPGDVAIFYTLQLRR